MGSRAERGVNSATECSLESTLSIPGKGEESIASLPFDLNDAPNGRDVMGGRTVEGEEPITPGLGLIRSLVLATVLAEVFCID